MSDERLSKLVDDRAALFRDARNVVRALVVLNDLHAELLLDRADGDTTMLEEALTLRRHADELTGMLTALDRMSDTSTQRLPRQRRTPGTDVAATAQDAPPS